MRSTRLPTSEVADPVNLKIRSHLTGGTSPQVFGRRKGDRSLLSAMRRGAGRRCPACGCGLLFKGFSTVQPRCSSCRLDFSGHEADDAPPWVTIMIVGHVAAPFFVAAKSIFDPSPVMQFAVAAPLIALSVALLLPASKGAIIGLQWANRMHGFGEAPYEKAASSGFM